MEMIERALWLVRLLLMRILGRLATADDSVCYVGSHETLPAPPAFIPVRRRRRRSRRPVVKS